MLKTFSGRTASQDEWELTQLLDLLKARKVHKYLEIGAREGDTFHAVGSVLMPGATMVAIDLPGGKWGYGTSAGQLWNACGDLRAHHGHAVHMVLGSSTKSVIVQQSTQYGPFDAVLIDGDHRYEGVSTDWEIYGKHAPMVVFHDIAGFGVIQRSSGDPVEVPRLWDEIKASDLYETHEYITPKARMGIGVVINHNWSAP